MRLDARDIADLQPLIAAAVRATLGEIEAEQAKLGARLAYTEPEAAALLGVARHVLRDVRLRGDIHGKLIGKRIVYSRTELMRYLGKA